MSKLENQSINKKILSFLLIIKNYQKNVSTIDTYQILFDKITQNLVNIKKLLDVGHGGSFDYDTNKVKEIVGLDLDYMIDLKSLPKNIKLEVGSALDIPSNLRDFDAVLFVMLIHHLVGKNIKENLLNLDKCVSESRKALSENGKLIIVESCVPNWFYFIEKLLFKPTNYLIHKFIKHPPAFQYTKEIIIQSLKKETILNLSNTKKLNRGNLYYNMVSNFQLF